MHSFVSDMNNVQITSRIYQCKTRQTYKNSQTTFKQYFTFFTVLLKLNKFCFVFIWDCYMKLINTTQSLNDNTTTFKHHLYYIQILPKKVTLKQYYANVKC